MTDSKQAVSSEKEKDFLLERMPHGVTKLVLNRTHCHNAFDDKLIRQLTDEIKALEQDSDTNIIVIAAKGKSFCSGADLNWMKRSANYNQEQNYADAMDLAELMQSLYSSKKLTIALVQGNAFGGGVGLLACCDIVLASDAANFCFSEVKLGLVPAVISPYVIKAIGERQSKRYFTTAELFNAEQAKAMQLVHEVFSHDKLEQQAEDYLNKLVKNGPQAMQKAKALINQVSDKTINQELIKQTSEIISQVRVSDEAQEGIKAFLEKRSPNWYKAN
jgi:methylglutaconyl-CoA hydratase